MLRAEVFESGKTLVQAAQELIEHVLMFVKDLSPVIVIALAPPFYPNVNNSKIGAEERVGAVVEKLSAYAKKRHGHEVITRYMTGMSDLSYVMDTTPDETVKYIEQNMLMWGYGYQIPFEEIKGFSMPVLNIGPEGRGMHMYTERVNKKSLFYDTPEFTDFVIRNFDCGIK